MPHPLLFRPDFNEDAEYKYEVKLTSYLLSFLGLHKYKNRVKCLKDFDNAFETFPVYIRVARIPGNISDLSISTLFNKITTRKVLQRYFAIIDENSELAANKPILLVFPWPKISKGLVVHNIQHTTLFDLPDDLEKPCTRFIWTVSKKYKKYGKAIFIEPFDQILSQIIKRTGWSHE